MIPFLRKSRTSLLIRFRELVRPARAAQIYLIDAEARCESARQAGAPLFASQLFQEASVFLHCATDELQHRRFAEAKVLALLAQTRASNALTIAEMAKTHSRDDLQQQLQSTLITVREIAERLFYLDKHSLQHPDRSKEQIHKALSDLQSAFRFLKDDDFSTARAHLGYASAMTIRLTSSLHDRPSFETINRLRRIHFPEPFDRWFVKQVDDIQRLIASPLLSEARDSAKTNAN